MKDGGGQGWRKALVQADSPVLELSLVVSLLWRGRLGEDWSGLGSPTFGWVLVSWRYPWFMSVQVFMPTISNGHFPPASSVWSHPTSAGHLGCCHCSPTVSKQHWWSCLCTKQMLFSFGLFPKERVFEVHPPKWNPWVTGNEWTVLWLLLHISDCLPKD